MPEDPALLESLPSTRNHSGTDSSPEYVGLIDQYVHNGWLKEFPTLQALSLHVGGKPIFNKWAGIDRTKSDGSIKRRLVMDSRRSGVTGASRKAYRSVLPRQTDLVADVLTLLDRKQAAQEVVLLVCDAEDAFWQVPLHPLERRCLLYTSDAADE